MLFKTRNKFFFWGGGHFPVICPLDWWNSHRQIPHFRIHWVSWIFHDRDKSTCSARFGMIGPLFGQFCINRKKKFAMGSPRGNHRNLAKLTEISPPEVLNQDRHHRGNQPKSGRWVLKWDPKMSKIARPFLLNHEGEWSNGTQKWSKSSPRPS